MAKNNRHSDDSFEVNGIEYESVCDGAFDWRLYEIDRNNERRLLGAYNTRDDARQAAGWRDETEDESPEWNDETDPGML